MAESTSLWEFRFSLTQEELVNLFNVVARSNVKQGLGRIYGALGAAVADSRGLTPSNIHYTHPAVFDDE